jgi:flagellar basal-body rod protein FlgC
MIPAVATAVSGLAASTAELAASASNIANAQTVGPLAGSGWGPAAIVGSAATAPTAQAYQPVIAVQYATAGGGVAARIAPVTPGTQPAYDPQSPYANAQGLVAQPDVDQNQETVGQIGTLTAFKANLAVLKVSDEMQQSLLAIA